jgi:hypothetical protein
MNPNWNDPPPPLMKSSSWQVFQPGDVIYSR